MSVTSLKQLLLLLTLIVVLTAAAGCAQDDGEDVADPAAGEDDTEEPNDGVGNGEDAEYELTFSSHVPETTAEMRIAQWYMDRVEELTDGRVQFDAHYLGALVEGPEVFSAIQDGRTEAGFHVSFYQPAELPITQVAGVPFVTEDAEAYTTALGEMWEDRENFQQEFLDHGVRPLTFIHLSSSTIGLDEPVESMDGLEGKRIRSAGLLAPVLEAAGAEPEAMPLGEVYEALQRDILQGWSSLALTPAVTNGLHEQAPYVHHTGIGMYLAPSFMISEEVWQEFPDDIQDAFNQASEEVPEAGAEITMETDAEVCQQLLDEGGEVVIWDDAAMQEWEDEVGDSAKQMWVDDVVEQDAMTEDEAWDFLEELEERVAEFEETSTYEDGLRACAAQQE